MNLYEYHGLSSRFFRSLSIDFVLLLAALLLLFRLVDSLLRSWRKPERAAQHGSVVMQFVLLSPLLIGVLLVIFQIALIVQAKFVVNYAAFCAARSAIVAIPASLHSGATGKQERANQIDGNDPQSPKMQIIRRAAAMACAGISPPFSGPLMVNTKTIPDASALAELTKIVFLFPANVSGTNLPTDFLSRSQYAFAPDNTRVEINVENHSSTDNNHTQFALVTVKVTYRYYLTVPFANRLFGKQFWGFSWFGSSAYYIPIIEEYTLPAETDPIFPQEQNPTEETP